MREGKGAGRGRWEGQSSPHQTENGEPPPTAHSPAAMRSSPGSPGLPSTVRKGAGASIRLSLTPSTQAGTRDWGTKTPLEAEHIPMLLGTKNGSVGTSQQRRGREGMKGRQGEVRAAGGPWG